MVLSTDFFFYCPCKMESLKARQKLSHEVSISKTPAQRLRTGVPFARGDCHMRLEPHYDNKIDWSRLIDCRHSSAVATVGWDHSTNEARHKAAKESIVHRKRWPVWRLAYAMYGHATMRTARV